MALMMSGFSRMFANSAVTLSLIPPAQAAAPRKRSEAVKPRICLNEKTRLP